MHQFQKFLPLWTIIGPLLAALVLVIGIVGFQFTGYLMLISATALVTAVLAAVHHAEVIAHRVGEPYGTLILAIAVTVIEVGLVLTLQLSGGSAAATVARDTVFAAVMIVTNGVLGACLLTGGLYHGEQRFRVQGASSLLSVLAALATLTLVLPTFTISSAGPSYTNAQLIFAGGASFLLYLIFVFVQTIRHHEYFLPHNDEKLEKQLPHTFPNTVEVYSSFVLLNISLIVVVGLAKTFSKFLDTMITSINAPQTVVGIIIALLVLSPETIAAIRAARANKLQTSLNLALGSGIASIGLTIPAVALFSVLFEIPLILGIDSKNLVLLVLTFMVCSFTLGNGRTTILQGTVHLIIFVAYLFLAFVP